MKNISFALTTAQVRARQKTVTRRLGWLKAKPGDLLQPVVKGMGLKKGQTVERIGGPIRLVAVRRELLRAIDSDDVVREGFPSMTPDEFVAMFCDHNGCTPDTEIARIEFEYVERGEESRG